MTKDNKNICFTCQNVRCEYTTIAGEIFEIKSYCTLLDLYTQGTDLCKKCERYSKR